MTIAEIAKAAVRRELPGFPTAGRQCLAFAFEVVARAYNTNRWLLYSRILDKTGADMDKSRWAKDAELGIERLGWDVLQRERVVPNDPQLRAKLQPGDLVFSRESGDLEGHVGIYVGDGLVAENTIANRGQWFKRKSALRLTPLERWNIVTSVARIPAGWRP